MQDDWTVGPRLTINAGVRWDYESDMLNNDYVTPRRQCAPRRRRSSTRNRYFTDGDDRPPFYGAWQPRVGLSYDLTGAGKHVLFGGYGRYYDRVIYNAGLDERFRLQYAVRSVPVLRRRRAAQRPGRPIVWDPVVPEHAPASTALIAAGVAPAPEVFLIDNDTRPPVSDQFNGGMRTSIRGILLSANYAGIRAQQRLDVRLRQPPRRRHLLPVRFPASATSSSRATRRRTGSTRCT